MDSLAVTYAGELARWGIETSIVVPGAFTKGTNHFPHAGAPADRERADEYDNGPYAGLPEVVRQGLIGLEPEDSDVNEVAKAIVAVVDAPFGRRPFRVHVDPSQDGAEVVNGVADRVRNEFLRRVGLEDLLRPASR
jgi:NAD(P)-dependent dehydrogenase (short-subunit alcohol dehydrogenase family)